MQLSPQAMRKFCRNKVSLAIAPGCAGDGGGRIEVIAASYTFAFLNPPNIGLPCTLQTHRFLFLFFSAGRGYFCRLLFRKVK